jgi:hypothetical protein
MKLRENTKQSINNQEKCEIIPSLSREEKKCLSSEENGNQDIDLGIFGIFKKEDMLANPKRAFDLLRDRAIKYAPANITSEQIQKNMDDTLKSMKENFTKDPTYISKLLTDIKEMEEKLNAPLQIKKPTADQLFFYIDYFDKSYQLTCPMPLFNGRDPEQSQLCLFIVELIKIADLDVLNEQDPKGFTPLHWAIFCRNWSMTVALHKRGVNLEIKSHDGRTPLMVGMGIITDFMTSRRDHSRPVEYLLYEAKASREGLTEKHLKKIADCEKVGWKTLPQIEAEEKHQLRLKEKQNRELKFKELRSKHDKLMAESIADLIPLTSIDSSLKQASTIVDIVMSTIRVDKDTSEDFRSMFIKLMRQVLEKLCSEHPLIERIFYFQARAALKEIPIQDDVISGFVCGYSALKIYGESGGSGRVGGFYIQESNITIVSFGSEQDFIIQANRYLDNNVNIANISDADTKLPTTINDFKRSEFHVLDIFTHEVLHNCLGRYFENGASIFAPENLNENWRQAEGIVSSFKSDFKTAENYINTHPEDRCAKWVYQNIVDMFPNDKKTFEPSFAPYSKDDISAEVPTHYISTFLSFANCNENLMNAMFPKTTKILYYTLDRMQRDYAEKYPNSCIRPRHVGDLETPEECEFNSQFKQHVRPDKTTSRSTPNESKANQVVFNNAHEKFFKPNTDNSLNNTSKSINEKKKKPVKTKNSSGLATGWFEQYSRECERERARENKASQSQNNSDMRELKLL